jgi:dTDP-4-dehydrorhamnose reductase
LRELSPSFPQYGFLFATRNDLDITQAQDVRDYFMRHNVDVVFNCAAYTAVDKAESDSEKAHAVNVTGVELLADACYRYKAVLFHVSTDFVFDGNKKTPYAESDATNPIGVYAQTKLDGERVALKRNPQTIVIRTSWVYSSFGNNFVKTMLRLGKEKPELSVVNDQTGSPTYAKDLAESMLHMLDETQPRHYGHVYNFSNDGVITWYEFAKAVLKNKSIPTPVHPIPTSGFPTPAKRPAYSVLDKSKIQRDFTVRLKPWEESLKACLSKLP